MMVSNICVVMNGHYRHFGIQKWLYVKRHHFCHNWLSFCFDWMSVRSGSIHADMLRQPRFVFISSFFGDVCMLDCLAVKRIR